jgi:hypothetical protein
VTLAAPADNSSTTDTTPTFSWTTNYSQTYSVFNRLFIGTSADPFNVPLRNINAGILTNYTLKDSEALSIGNYYWGVEVADNYGHTTRSTVRKLTVLSNSSTSSSSSTTSSTSTTINGVISKVPDTGQTKCYNSSTEIPCPQPGQPFYGQDAQYGPNIQSFTDLGNGIVRDNVTGLEWQQATVPGTYTWAQAITYCENLVLPAGGYSDWRLPTIKELSTLVDSSIPYPGPTINTTFFPGTVASYYWSSTTYAYYTSYAWGVSFGYGYVMYYDKTNNYYVRAVRGGQ